MALCYQPSLSALVAVVFLLLLTAPPPSSAQQGLPCPPPGGVVTSDFQLSQHISLFPDCSVITGSVVIGHQNCSIPCTLTSLAPLAEVTFIEGSLRIQCCHTLTDISGLTNLEGISGSLSVYYNRELVSISGVNLLQRVEGSITIAQNQKLRSISGFSALSTINGYLSLERNEALTDISGLRRLNLIRGEEILSGHALSIVYNAQLSNLTGLSGIAAISYGTVRIEGNSQLCYAGYPVWNFGGYGIRPSMESDSRADKGIDWRTRLSGVEPWQYTWGVEGGGIPTLLIQNNAPNGSCGEAVCSSSCPPNAGCFGPNDPTLCGSCDLVGTFDPCDTGLPESSSNTAVIVGVVVVVVGVVLLVLIGLGIWGGVVFTRKWKEGRQGSFDISVTQVKFSDLESADSAPTIITKKQKTAMNSDLIASNAPSSNKNDSTPVTIKTTSARYISDEPPSVRDKARNELPKKVGVPGGDVARDSPSLGAGGVSRKPPSPQLVKKQHQRESTENLLASSSSQATPTQEKEEKGEDSPVEGGGAVKAGLERGPGVEDQKLVQEKSDVPMNFPKDQVKTGKVLGVGDFGKVLLAEAKKLFHDQKKTVVVVKQLKPGASEQEKQDFLRPVEAMKVLRHANVLSLLGVVSSGPALQVMLEYCSQGNFKTFLVTKRKEAAILMGDGTLLRMATDMASGLNYLHSMSIAHNDFAVRSCLVTGEGKVKLGDYGITRQTFKEDYYSRSPTQKAWPIRWMAPEQVVLEGKSFLDSHPVSMPANIWATSD